MVSKKKMVKDKTRVLFLPTNVTGVNFYRMYQYYNELKKLGYDTAIYKYTNNQERLLPEWLDTFVRDKSIREELFGVIKFADVVVMGYNTSPMIAMAIPGVWQENFKKRFITETDDYVIDTPTYNPAHKSGFTPSHEGNKVIIEQMCTSKAVVCSCDYLKECYGDLNDNTYVIPNAIDFKLWDKARVIKNKRLTIGWAGGANHEEDFRIMKEVIPAILKKYKDVEFKIIHGAPTYIKDMKNSRVRTSEDWYGIDDYPKGLAGYGFDIGIAPLIDSRFNRAKSNLKWLEMSALKTPIVASNIETYNKSIVDGKTGFLASTEKEWIDKLSILIESASLRKNIGKSAYREVKTKWSLPVAAKKYAEVIEKVLKE